jgi:signal transduction histidine kinase
VVQCVGRNPYCFDIIYLDQVFIFHTDLNSKSVSLFRLHEISVLRGLRQEGELKMDKIQKEIKKAQKRDWQLWSLMIFLFLIFTSFIVLIIFYSDLQEIFSEQIDAFMFNFLLIGFVALSLLFIGYVVVKEVAVKKLQKYLVEERIASQVLEKRLGELTALFELSNLVNSQLELSAILDVISSKALRCLGGDQSSLFLYDPKKNKLRCVSVWGPEYELVKNAEIEIGKSVAGWVMKHGRPLHLGEDLEAYQFSDFVEKKKKITSSLCVPLMVKNKPKGVLNVSLMEQDRKFTENDLKLVSIFAENAAIAIEKAELYTELRKKTETLEKTIEELKATQDQLIQSEKLRALGNLASGVAHDFNNILAAILGRTQLLLRKVQDPDLLKWLKVIEQLTNAGAETVERIQKFARTHRACSEKDFQELNINEIVQEVVEITRPKWKDEAELKGINIDIETDLGEMSTSIGNVSEIKEVLTNMIFNSIEALPEGGKIIIKTRTRGEDILISVSDNGLGMIEEVKKKVFEPFFTTKRDKRNGLGLSVAYGIITRHNGEITVESQPGEGTTFTIKLPAKQERLEKVEV